MRERGGCGRPSRIRLVARKTHLASLLIAPGFPRRAHTAAAAAAAAAAGTCTIRIISTYTIRLHRRLILRSTDRRLPFAYHATSVHTVGATPYRLHALFFFGADRSPRSLTKSHWHRKTFFPLGSFGSPSVSAVSSPPFCVANRALGLLHRLWPSDIARSASPIQLHRGSSRAANSRLVSYLVSTTYLPPLYPPAGSATREDQSPESRAQSLEARVDHQACPTQTFWLFLFLFPSLFLPLFILLFLRPHPHLATPTAACTAETYHPCTNTKPKAQGRTAYT